MVVAREENATATIVELGGEPGQQSGIQHGAGPYHQAWPNRTAAGSGQDNILDAAGQQSPLQTVAARHPEQRRSGILFIGIASDDGDFPGQLHASEFRR